jgi:hypothetical protein
MSARPLTAQALADIPVFRATDLKTGPGGGSWAYQNLVGVLAEVSEEVASGALSFVAEIILQAQSRNEPAAWVSGTESVFFPPDMSGRGIDLSALAVIRVGGQPESLTAVEWLVRSGALGLVIVDAQGRWTVTDACLGRLLKLAEKNQCAVVFLTRKRPEDPSLGSRISVRGCIGAGARPFQVDLATVKDKRSNSSSRLSRQYYGPPGMH